MTQSSESQLDKEDLIILKDELKNVILIYLVILIVGGIFFYAGLTILFLVKTLNQTWIIISYCFVGIIAYLAFLWGRIKIPFYDLFSKRKLVVIGFVQDKPTQTNFGWSGNLAQDLTRQPILEEHYIVVNNKQHFINRKDFLTLEIGDVVKLSFTTYSKRLIRVERIDISVFRSTYTDL